MKLAILFRQTKTSWENCSVTPITEVTKIFLQITYGGQTKLLIQHILLQRIEVLELKASVFKAGEANKEVHNDWLNVGHGFCIFQDPKSISIFLCSYRSDRRKLFSLLKNSCSSGCEKPYLCFYDAVPSLAIEHAKQIRNVKWHTVGRNKAYESGNRSGRQIVWLSWTMTVDNWNAATRLVPLQAFSNYTTWFLKLCTRMQRY